MRLVIEPGVLLDWADEIQAALICSKLGFGWEYVAVRYGLFRL